MIITGAQSCSQLFTPSGEVVNENININRLCVARGGEKRKVLSLMRPLTLTKIPFRYSFSYQRTVCLLLLRLMLENIMRSSPVVTGKRQGWPVRYFSLSVGNTLSKLLGPPVGPPHFTAVHYSYSNPQGKTGTDPPQFSMSASLILNDST